MLRIIKNIKPKNIKFSFGGHAEQAPVVINQQQQWISDQNTSQVAIFGFNDINDEAYHEEHIDPFPHCRNASFFSLERLVFSDPFYHEDHHEDLMNTPHGYLTCDDPLDPRNNFERPILEYLCYFVFAMIVGLMLGCQGTHLVSNGNRLYSAVLTAEQIEDEIREIRKQNSELEQLRDSLKQ